MQTITSLDALDLAVDPRPKIVCIGMFDGVHLGHRALIKRAVDEARRRDGLAVALSFQNHPLRQLAPAYAPPLLMPWRRKAALFADLGIDIAVIIPFDERVMRLSPGEFVDGVLIGKCGAAMAVCGYDFRFAQNAAGTPELLRELMAASGREAFILPKVQIRDVTVSSTLIRDLIGERRIDEAPKYLGDFFKLDGRVVTGKGRGRTIGFPTANLEVDPDVLIPPRGVYAARVSVGGQVWPGMVNIGRRPTFETDGAKTIEAHIIGFGGDLPGREIEVAFIAHLRPERKYDSPEALVAQLQKDRARALALFRRDSTTSNKADQ